MLVDLKKMFLVFIGATTILVATLAGVSYAWYESNTGKTTVNVATTGLDVNFNTSDVIATTTSIPILDSEASTKAASSTFSVTVGSGQTMNGQYTISLVDVTIADALKTPTFKYQLLKGGVEVAGGNFATIGSSTTLSLYTTALTMSPATNDSYELRIWLSELCADITTCNRTQTSQNSQMNKSFSAKVQVLSVFQPS